ncbi:hypothetical protein CSHISOI_09735 [Colletotrichum shisoi]|uniref:Uncharacterized protein n=1 Tax=Colletotrichum shisoi TaxID=2078593 RepID=A0A5Q4BFI7_9PEZI|nr:hypothetical protein CSHISOI_09735 [Colletotrichum shisoi]
MASIGSNSSKGSSASGSQKLRQIMNLNPSARPFTPTGSGPPPYSTYPNIDLVPPPMRLPPERKPTTEPGGQRTSAAYVQRVDDTMPSLVVATNSVGLADLDAPKTPPNLQPNPRRGSPTPAAYIFADDDEFYPGTDPRLKKNARWVKC